MLTVAKILEAIEGLDPEAQVVVGIMGGPSFSAAYAEQQVRGIADIDPDHHLTLPGPSGLALYICCYEQPRPWEGPTPTTDPDGNAIFEYRPPQGE